MNKVIIGLLLTFVCANAAAQDVQLRLDAGLSYHSVRYYEFINEDIPPFNPFEIGQYLAIAVNQSISTTSSLGTRFDIQQLDGHTLNSVRALDYYYQAYDSVQLNAFIGAARYNYRTPAYGYTAGFGAYYRPAAWQDFGLSFELQYMDKLARDKLHPDDPEYPWDSFIDMRAATFGFNYYF